LAYPDLRHRIERTLSGWRAKQQQGDGSIVMDDGNPTTRPTANTVRYMIQDSEHDALEDDRSNNDTTQDDLVNTNRITNPIMNPITNTIADDGLMPKYNLYIAVSMEEDIDKLSNRWILDPGSNTHVINTEDWKG
jgi:hypothetical protein